MRTTAHRIRHWCIQGLRRAMQISAIGLTAGLIYLSLYAHYRATFSVDEAIQEPGLEARLLAHYDTRIEALDDPEQFIDENNGTVWSMQIAGIEWTDPLAAAESMAASRRVDDGRLWFSILIPVLITLLLGKVFCSWICPANLILELTGKVRHVLRFAELPPAEVKFSRAN